MADFIAADVYGLDVISDSSGVCESSRGRSANLIVALLVVIIYLNVVNIFQAMVSQGRIEFSIAWWPVHLIAIMMTFVLFFWRIEVNHRWHPLVLWSRGKACLRSKEKESVA
jgi:lipopolysaccharide export system permease protein